jgi:hypothetical protein
MRNKRPRAQLGIESQYVTAQDATGLTPDVFSASSLLEPVVVEFPDYRLRNLVQHFQQALLPFGLRLRARFGLTVFFKRVSTEGKLQHVAVQEIL